MKFKILLLLACCLIAPAAWYAQRSDTFVDAGERGERELPEQYRDTVNKALEYLIKNQHADGRWEGDGGKHPVAVTALAGMALLMDGSTVKKGKYSENLRKAVDYLVSKSDAKREGLIFSDHPSETNRYMQGHGLATQFLAWAYQGEADDPRRKKLDDVLTKAVKYIAKAQSSQGGWYDTSKVEGHDFDSVAATAIQIHALYMISELGIAVRSEAIALDAQAYLKKAIEKFEKGGKPAPNRSRSAETAAALACRFNPNAYLDQDGVANAWFKICKTEVPMGDKITFGRDEMTHYYYSQAIYTLKVNPELNARGDAPKWEDYRKSVFDHLQKKQEKDGSWPAPTEAPGGVSVGPVYATAVWCTVLQFDKRHHPLTQSRVRITF
jgi:hypothetical protein